MATERILAMQIVELHAEDLVTAIDFVAALKNAIGAPEWHGDSIDAFLGLDDPPPRHKRTEVALHDQNQRRGQGGEGSTGDDA